MSTALVLGGGGITGIAWETVLLWGLAEAGVDLTDAERVVGTSAGSIVGAQVTSSTPLEELYRRQLLAPAELGDGGVPLALRAAWRKEELAVQQHAVARAQLMGVSRTD